MKQTIKLSIAFLLMAALFAACVPDQDIAGARWSDTWIYTEEGEQFTVNLDLVLNTESTGTLFLNETHSGMPMGGGFAIPVNYTWDDNHGTATGTVDLTELYMAKTVLPKGGQAVTLDMDYTKVEGFRVTLGGELGQWFGIVNHTLQRKEYVKNPALEGTTWLAEWDEQDEDWGGELGVHHYRYEMNFTSGTAAVLNMQYTDPDGDTMDDRWNVNVSMTNGLGTTSIYFDGETAQGGFYLPDAQHLTFCDGASFIQFSKQ